MFTVRGIAILLLDLQKVIERTHDCTAKTDDALMLVKRWRALNNVSEDMDD